MSLAVGNLVLPGAAGRACFDRVRREGHATGCLQGNTAGDGLLGGHSALVDRLPALSGASVTWGRQWRAFPKTPEEDSSHEERVFATVVRPESVVGFGDTPAFVRQRRRIA